MSKGKLDQGSILGVKELKVEGRVKVKTLEHVLAREGANLLVDILKDLPTAQVSFSLLCSFLSLFVLPLIEDSALIHPHLSMIS